MQQTDPSIADWLINFLTRSSTYGFNLVDFSLNILVDFHISLEILSGWLIWLTSFIHSSWLSYQPGDTFGWLVWLTFISDFWLTPWLILFPTFWLTLVSARKYSLVDILGWLFWLTFSYHSGWLILSTCLVDILVD